MNEIRAWLAREPLLTRVGPVVLAVSAYLLAKGTLDQETADLITAVVLAFGGGGALMFARAQVRPESTPPGKHRWPKPEMGTSSDERD